jgi:hypothetical protein
MASRGTPRVKQTIPAEVAEALKSYVYVLLDPVGAEPPVPFYVGKGIGARAVSHLYIGDLKAELSGEDHRTRSATQKRIRKIRAAGAEPEVDIVRHGLTEDQAFMIEAALIATLPDLTNAVGGHDHDRGRAPLDEVITRYGAPVLDGSEPPAVLIRLGRWTDEKDRMEGNRWRVGKGWRRGVSDAELHDSVRAWWRLSPRSIERRGVHHAVAVHEGVTRAVLEIDAESWTSRDDGRWLFAGKLLRSGGVFDAYVGPLGRRVPRTKSAQNPVTYWPPAP